MKVILDLQPFLSDLKLAKEEVDKGTNFVYTHNLVREFEWMLKIDHPVGTQITLTSCEYQDYCMFTDRL